MLNTNFEDLEFTYYMMEGVLTGMKFWLGGGNASIPQCVRQEMNMGE